MPAALLVRVALLGLVEVGVDLEGERGAGGEHLEQEREAGAELLDGRLRPVRATGRRRSSSFERAALGAGGGAGVGAHPHLGLGLAGGGDAEQLRDGGGGSPGVGAHGVGEAVHGVCRPA